MTSWIRIVTGEIFMIQMKYNFEFSSQRDPISVLSMINSFLAFLR